MHRRRAKLGWVIAAVAAVALLAAAGSSLAGAQGDDSRRGSDPLSSDEIQSALDDSGAPPAAVDPSTAAPESFGDNGLPGQLVLMVERHLEDKDADPELRRADVYEYDYGTDTLTRQVVDLSDGHVDDTTSGQGTQLPLIDIEEQRALDLLMTDDEFSTRLHDEYQQATGQDLTDPATELDIQPIVFLAESIPTLAQGAASQCGVHRCAQFLIQTTDHVLINLFPIVDLSATTVLTADGVAPR